MKKEILYIHNLNLRYSNSIRIEDISLRLMEGESTGFLGLTSSGKDALLKVICGMEWPSRGKIYVDGRYIACAEAMKKEVHRMAAINYAITGWTVSEYIGLVTEHFLPKMFYAKKLINEVEELLETFDIDIDARKKMGELSELEKRLIDLVKACRKQTRILVIEDEFEGCTVEEIRAFKAVMNRITRGRMTVALNTYSETLNQILPDNYMILKNGRVVKKCKTSDIKDKEQLETHLLGEPIPLKQEHRPSRISAEYKQPEMYRVKNLVLGNKDVYDISCGRSEIISLIVLNIKEKERIFNLLSGRMAEKTVELYLESKRCHFKCLADFVKNKIVSSAHIGTADELLPFMTVGDNILMPSLSKISSTKYISSGSKLTKMLEQEIGDKAIAAGDTLGNKEVISQIAIMLERWYVYKPKVIVLAEPFIQCDAQGAALVKSYINRFAQSGATVIIVSSKAENIEDISDCVINIG